MTSEIDGSRLTRRPLSGRSEEANSDVVARNRKDHVGGASESGQRPRGPCRLQISACGGRATGCASGPRIHATYVPGARRARHARVVVAHLVEEARGGSHDDRDPGRASPAARSRASPQAIGKRRASGRPMRSKTSTGTYVPIPNSQSAGERLLRQLGRRGAVVQDADPAPPPLHGAAGRPDSFRLLRVHRRRSRRGRRRRGDGLGEPLEVVLART